jgi:hypothetical protein
MSAEPSPATSYVFGPLERRGLIGGLRAGQICLIGLGIAGLVAALSSAFPLAGLVVLFGSLAAAFLPVAGRNADLWAPITTAFWFRRLTGGRQWRNDACRLGHIDGEPAWPTLPAHLRALRIVDVAGDGAGAPFGVVVDGPTYTAVLGVRPEAFALCDSGEQARRLAGWGGILAGVAREGSPISRLQWVERTAPADASELIRAARGELAVGDDHPLAQDYLELLFEAGPATQAHETFLAVQVDRRRAARLIRAAGGGDEGAVAVLRREVATLVSNLGGVDVAVTGLLQTRALSRAIRLAFDPGARAGLARRAALDPDHAGVAPAAAWPAVIDEQWGCLRADDAFHATFWVEEWPRIPVRPDFLSPLLLGSRSTRTVSLTVESVPPGRAARQVEAARTADLADEELRRRGGFLSSARRRRQAEGVARREEELADGHADCRFSGYVTVSAPDPDALEDACGEVEQLAQQCRLQLTRLRGQQAEAFTWTLPLCRGLR